jgi:AraC-like DNA-binding protein
MPTRSPTLPVRYVAPLAEYVESLGPSWRSVLRAARLDESLFDAPDASMTLAQFDALRVEIERVTGRTDLGFELGRHIEVTTHGAIGEAMLHCSTLDHALRLASRFFPLVTPAFAMDYRRRGREARISFRPKVAMTRETLRVINEIHAVSFHFQWKSLLPQRLKRYDVFVPMNAPPHARRYRELAPARFHFAPMPLPEVRVVVDAAQVDLPLATANPQNAAHAEDRLKRQRPPLALESRWSDWVILMLREAEDCQPTLEQLAELVGIGSYTLARLLAKEGESFRDLSNRVRFDRARSLLAQGRNPITQIAYRLGYTDVANFSTAFRLAYGKSPRAYRATTQHA